MAFPDAFLVRNMHGPGECEDERLMGRAPLVPLANGSKAMPESQKNAKTVEQAEHASQCWELFENREVITAFRLEFCIKLY